MNNRLTQDRTTGLNAWLFMPSLLSVMLLNAIGGEIIDFDQAISPILSRRCYQCHGPDAQHIKGDLRLDLASAENGPFAQRDGYRIIEAGEPEKSELWLRIVATDPDEQMPPPESKHQPLDERERGLIYRWIQQGAKYQNFWAFETPIKRSLPEVADSDWMEHPIDRWVGHALEQRGMKPSGLADPRSLIRRLSLDLTGLPPSPEEVYQWLEDPSEAGFEDVVDRYLNRPAFGEHMAKYWLDLVRFADTNGLHHDHYRDMTPYRDWVIRSFNDNLPFDAFLSYQLAGDLYPDASTDQLIASGFNRLHLIIDVGTALPEESFTRNVVDRVTAFGTAFLGLTVQCASCHDHKFDPVSTREFYQLFAFFNNFDGQPETGGRSGLDFRRGLQAPYMDLPSPAQRNRLLELDRRLRDLSEAQAAFKATIPEASCVGDQPEQPLSEEQARQNQRLQAMESQIKSLRVARDELMMTVPAAMIMKEREAIRPAHILKRGVYDQYGQEVQRDTPAVLPPLNAATATPSRLDLARWVTRADHPLTARVAVNRFWQQLFGTGLVKTSEDFGLQGERPSHPALLDYLAREFVDSGWDLKRLIKHIVMSRTYRQHSVATLEQRAMDPENRLLARGSRYRMDAEMIRDEIFHVSGLLNHSIGGKSVKPPQPAKLWEIVAMPNSYPRTYQPDEGGKIYRRSLYTFWKRALPPPQMSLFDAPSREACVARRERTNTPLQALLLMNEPEFFKAAAQLANQLVAMEGVDDLGRLSMAHEMVTTQIPSEREITVLVEALHAFRTMYGTDPAAARQLADLASGSEILEAPELAAWTMITHSLFNLDTVRYRQ